MRTGRRDWLWGVAVGVVLLAGAFFVFVLTRGGSEAKTLDTVDGVDCQTGERLEYHVHAWLAILIDGQQIEVSPNIGIRNNCLFWLHTHNNSGLLHVEAPEQGDFTLGQFFSIWGQPLSSTQLLDQTTDATHEIEVTVNGEPYTGDPRAIILGDQQTIVLQYGPPFGEPIGNPFAQ